MTMDELRARHVKHDDWFCECGSAIRQGAESCDFIRADDERRKLLAVVDDAYSRGLNDAIRQYPVGWDDERRRLLAVVDGPMVEAAMRGGYVAELPADVIAARLRAALDEAKP